MILRKLALFGMVLAIGLRAPAQSAPTITSQPASLTVGAGGTANFAVGVTGSEPLTYQWRLNGTNLFLTGSISTVVGTGAAAYTGDGDYATNATLSQPESLALDGMGNLYIADTYNNVVRMVSPDGIISTVAGDGVAGYSGDFGSAIDAELNTPTTVAVDAGGNLYIADFLNSCVRMVDTQGIITTFAGTGTNGFSGDDGPATSANLYYPGTVAVDSTGDVFISDVFNERIRKVDIYGTITTVAGDGNQGYSGDGGQATNASLSSPSGLALDASGNLFLADAGNNVIRMIDTNGIISTVAGTRGPGYSGDGGPATNAVLNNPIGIAFDSGGGLLIGDNGNDRVRRIATNGLISTICGNGNLGFSGDGGPPIKASLAGLYSVIGDSYGNIFVADWANNRVREIAVAGPAIELDNVSAANAGNYDVIISNSYGSVTSKVAVLTVTVPAGIASQPTGQSVEIGSGASFSVAGSGTAPLSYQWYASAVAVNATATPIVINGFLVGATINNGGAGYLSPPQVRITGGSGSGATATAQVSNGAVTAVQIQTTGTGYTTPPTIRIAAPPPIRLTGQTNIVLTLDSISAGEAGSYYVTVTNAYGSATSDVVTLTVLLQPAITVEPQSQSVPFDGDATLSVTAVGGGVFGYQWYVSPAQYAARATSQIFGDFVVGATVTSPGEGYTSAPQVSIQGGGGAGATATTTIANGSVTAVTIGATGSGYTTSPVVQIAPPPFLALAGQTNSVLNLNPATIVQAGEYYVVVTNAYGSVTSSIVELTVGPPPLTVTFSQSAGLQMGFSGLPGSPYILLTTTNLTPAPPVIWLPLFTNTASASGNWSFADTNTRAYPERYYRVITP